MKILVTGASGYVGASIFTNLNKHYEVVGTFHKNKLFKELLKLDITERKAVIQTLLTLRPELIVHTAAMSSRRTCKVHPENALAVNFEGTKNIADAANIVNSKIIYISTLGVGEYPSTQYGKTKLMGEHYVRKVHKNCNILRLSMTFGYSPNLNNDRPFNRILKTLQTGHPSSYDNCWRFMPTYLKDVSETIMTLTENDIQGRILTVAIPELKSAFDVASDILKPFGRKVIPKNNDKGKLEKISDQNKTHLPISSYHEMISGIMAEIRQYHLDKLSVS
jgi:dTDP-4-dehydrorhamnose reductase